MSKVMARCLMPVHMKVAISSHPKPIFHSRISPPLAKNFATEKVHLLFFRAVNEIRSNS
jgi:hypothetical protein